MRNYNDLNTNKKYKVLFVCLGSLKFMNYPSLHGAAAWSFLI